MYMYQMIWSDTSSFRELTLHHSVVRLAIREALNCVSSSASSLPTDNKWALLFARATASASNVVIELVCTLMAFYLWFVIVVCHYVFVCNIRYLSNSSGYDVGHFL